MTVFEQLCLSEVPPTSSIEFDAPPLTHALGMCSFFEILFFLLIIFSVGASVIVDFIFAVPSHLSQTTQRGTRLSSGDSCWQLEGIPLQMTDRNLDQFIQSE